MKKYSCLVAVVVLFASTVKSYGQVGRSVKQLTSTKIATFRQ